MRAAGEPDGRAGDAALPARVRRMLRLRSPARDLEEELSFHFERSVEALMAEGYDAEAAAREARRRFGDAARWRAELARIDSGGGVRARLGGGLRACMDVTVHAARSVQRGPGLSLMIVAALGLGIGANATMFRVVDRLWLTPPAHISAPDEVVRLLAERQWMFSPERRAQAALSYPDFEDLRAARGFAGVVAASPTRLTVGHGESAERLEVVLATGDYFRVLGVRPAVGRFFDESEDVAGEVPRVVLSHGYWQRAYGGSPAAIGQAVDFGRGPYTIVGVAPRGFTGTEVARVDAWLPLHAAAAEFHSEQYITGRGVHWLAGFARLAPGVSPEAAAEEATALHRAGRAELIAADRYDAAAAIVPASLIVARGPLARAETDVARWLLAVAFLVLLIASVNVANLLLARVLRRHREIGIRLALGVSRRRLVGQHLLEGVMLGALGGTCALLLARWGTPLVGGVLLPDVDWGATALGARAVAVTVALALLAGLLSALPPSIQLARRGVGEALRSGAGGAITRSTARARGALALVQAALSVLLLVGAALFVRSLERVRGAELGYQPRDLAVVNLTFVRGALSPAERAAFFDAAPARLERLPNVAAAAATFTSPFGTVITQAVRVPGREFVDPPRGGEAYVHGVSPGYFRALRIDVREGRGFTDADRAGALPVVVINRTLARHGWPDGGALGGCVLFEREGAECQAVVGIVEDPYMDSLTPRDQFQVWMPAAQRPFATAENPVGVVPDRLLVRLRGDPAVALEAVRRELHAADPRVRFVEAQTLRAVMSRVTRSWELGATMFTLFGGLALLVAALGLYAVLAFDVAQRTRELGVRAALGAARGSLVGGVVARGLRLTAAGVATGLAAAWLLAPRLGDLLFGVAPRDAVSFAGAAAALFVVALAASAIPALRATRVDPMEALRAE